MKIGILGSGIAGQTVGRKVASLGHSVVLGTRHPTKLSETRGMGGSLADWLAQAGGNGRVGTFAEAAAHGEVVVNATQGTASIEALRAAGADNLDGKVLIDLANELDFSRGVPPRSLASDAESLGERIQQAFPKVRVVKTLNTTNAEIMIDPARLAGAEHTIFMSGNDADAKERVADLLRSFGWRDIIDLGDITTARGTEMLLPIWLRLWGTLQTPVFNFKIVR
jgi:predicted dinucleotide-binding enzyme